MFANLVAIIAPTLLVAGLGYGWARLGYGFERDFVTRIVFNVGAPCLIFSALSAPPGGAVALGNMGLAAGCAYAAFLTLAWGVTRIARLNPATYLPPLAFPNTGNMGLPLCLFAFGETGLAYAIAFFVTGTALQFTLGVAVSSGRLGLENLVRAPVLYATAAALALIALGVSPPRWLLNTTRLVGNLAIPLMLITLGVSLARLRVSSFGRSLAFAVMRLAGGFAIGLGVVHLLGLHGAERGVVIIEASMPAAVLNYLLASRYQHQPEEVAGIILLSTVLSFLTLPLLLGIALD